MTTGAYDYLLKVVAPSLDAYAEFTLQHLLKMPGVKDVRSSFRAGDPEGLNRPAPGRSHG